MSEPITATPGAIFDGFASVRDTGPRGMVAIRGEGETLDTIARALGLTLPPPRAMTSKDGARLAWMSPDELLLICAYEDAPALAARAETALGAAHGLVAVVSDARVVFRVEGPRADEVLRKLTPADMDALGPGTMRRTRLAQVAAGIWMPGPQVYEVMCFRSVGAYVFDLLANAAKPGSELEL